MPKTTVQKVIFGLLMSFFMVLAMEMYNTGLRNGGLTNAGILNALRELPLMFALCFLTSTVVGEPWPPAWRHGWQCPGSGPLPPFWPGPP